MKSLLIKTLTFLTIIFCCAQLLAADEYTHTFTNPEDASRYHVLTQEIRCLVCQNQNIADSNAPLANDLREKVYQMVLQQKSDDEIKSYMVKRYGEFILLNPRFNPTTAILWGFPLLGLMIVFGVMVRFVRRQMNSLNRE